jgi:hypothetical protein
MDLSILKRAPGVAAGAALAPWAALGSAVRRARVFHPRGMLVWGTVTPIARPDEWNALGARLRGSVLIRFSGAWWKERQWLDVLGCALRFTRASKPSVEPLDDDQDLLLATVRVPGTTLIAPLTTRVDDYLRNAYFGVSPFTAPGVPKLKLRLRIATPIPTGAETRAESLELALALARNPVRLLLEARRAIPLAAYAPIAEIELQERVDIDQAALSFDPYRTGRGLSPAGFVHAMRIPVYAASRSARHALGA